MMPRLIQVMLTVMLTFSWVAGADDMRPLYVEIGSEGKSHTIRVQLPPGIDPRNEPSLVMPAHCLATEVGGRYSCQQVLAGAELSLVWPLYDAQVPAVVRWIEGDRTHMLAVRAGETSLTLPGRQDTRPMFTQYLVLGVEHILIGYDHLLFLACLVWIAGTIPRILLAVTGFTLAHSVTLALATFDIVRLPVPWVEAVIALSVLFLAAELVRDRPTLTRRFPLLVSACFGLVHGLGFAAVLGEIGMPREGIVAGLLGFNLGVEAGQVMFITACWLLVSLMRSLDHYVPRIDFASQRFSGYAIGIFAGFWVVERVVLLMA